MLPGGANGLRVSSDACDARLDGRCERRGFRCWYGTCSALRSPIRTRRGLEIPEPVDSYFRCLGAAHFFSEFYRRLLASHPAMAPLFDGTDWDRQHVLLRSGLVMMLLHAGGNPAASSALARIGQRHGPSGLRVEPTLYDHWVESLLETVRSCDPQCSPAIERAWRDVARRAIGVMLGGGVTSPGSSERSQ